MELSIPTTEDIRAAVRDELATFFSSHMMMQPAPLADEIGRGAEYASKVTGKAVATIYDLVHKRQIPHSKQGKDLYFSRRELMEWLQSGRRKTQSEIANEAEAR
jgi:excisionase family DNA binding protein